MLDQVGLLLLDRDRAGPERRVLVGRVLLDDPVAGLGLDAGLLGVVDAAGQVAVGVGDRRRGEQPGKERHLGTSGEVGGPAAVVRADGWPRARSVRSPDGPVKRAGAVAGDAAAPADRPCWLSFPPMTDRGLPIVDGAPACPFVAFEDDRDGRGQAPDHRHRCFAEPRPAPRALAHQEAYCLSSAFPVCPTFQDWARREAATARAAQLEAEPPALEEPVSQSLPPRELEPQHAPSTDTPPPLPPRRNPPRAWADPPPWAGDARRRAGGAPVVPRRARRPPAVRPARRRGGRRGAPRHAGWPAAPPTGSPAATSDERRRAGRRRRLRRTSCGVVRGRRVVSDPNERHRPAVKAAAAAGSAAAYQAASDASPTPAAAAAGPVGSTGAARPRRRRDGRQPSAPRQAAAQDPAELFGPAWERAAHATRRTRRCGPASGLPVVRRHRRGSASPRLALVLARRRAVLHRPDAARHRRQRPGRRRRAAASPAGRGR